MTYLRRNKGNSIRGIYFVISLLSLKTTTYVKALFMGLAVQTWVKRSDLEIWLCLSLSQAWKIGVLTAKKKGSLTLWRFMAFASHNCLVLTTLYFGKGVVKRAIDVEICRDRLTLSANCVVPLESWSEPNKKWLTQRVTESPFHDIRITFLLAVSRTEL